MPAFAFHELPSFSFFRTSFVAEKNDEIDQGKANDDVIDQIVHGCGIAPKNTLLYPNPKMLFGLFPAVK